MTISTAIYERSVLPRATVSLDSETGALTCVVDEISDLNPLRTVSGEEVAAGVQLLNPPTVKAATPRELITAAQLAVDAACSSSAGRALGPEALMARFKTAMAVKGALRMLGVVV